ncbi:hypothetical protein ACPPVW_03790 [Leifsonia sp. McL0607]|uniref:hypothetical protein n=1 Tax=Leifsonia sp. McL0607 TaxID=3415672 RepID=UPI003CF5DE3D
MLRRRTIVGAAAWAAPAIALSVGSPAYAASVRDVTLSLVAPSTAKVGTLSPDAVYATVRADGKPGAGVAVTFTVVNAALGGFGADDEQSVTVVTDGAGIARPPAMLLKVAKLVQITATAAGRAASAYIAVSQVVVTAGTMAFKPSTVNVAAASTFALAGALTRTAGSGYPPTVSLVYPAGYAGPATVPVDQATGEFLVPGVKAGTIDGTITANAPGFGTATVAITVVLGYISSVQSIYAAGPGLAAPRNRYVITGMVDRVTPGAALPATVTLTWRNGGNNYENVTGFTNGQTVAVNQTTGAFTLPTLTPIDTGDSKLNGGNIKISATGYQAYEILLLNRPSDVDVDWCNSMSTTPGLTVFAPGSTRDVTGHSLVRNGLQEVKYYGEGFTGPATVTTDASGAYTLRGVKAPEYISSGIVYLNTPGSIGYSSSGLFYVL